MDIVSGICVGLFNFSAEFGIWKRLLLIILLIYWNVILFIWTFCATETVGSSFKDIGGRLLRRGSELNGV